MSLCTLDRCFVAVPVFQRHMDRNLIFYGVSLFTCTIHRYVKTFLFFSFRINRFCRASWDHLIISATISLAVHFLFSSISTITFNLCSIQTQIPGERSFSSGKNVELFATIGPIRPMLVSRHWSSSPVPTPCFTFYMVQLWLPTLLLIMFLFVFIVFASNTRISHIHICLRDQKMPRKN